MPDIKAHPFDIGFINLVAERGMEAGGRERGLESGGGDMAPC